MDTYVKIFLTGWGILAVAILINILEIKFGISTWYSFLQEAGKVGPVKAFLETSLISKLFLFIIYPSLLGLVGFLLLKK